jgi:hypothetical protein
MKNPYPTIFHDRFFLSNRLKETLWRHCNELFLSNKFVLKWADIPPQVVKRDRCRVRSPARQRFPLSLARCSKSITLKKAETA